MLDGWIPGQEWIQARVKANEESEQQPAVTAGATFKQVDKAVDPADSRCVDVPQSDLAY